MRGNEFLDKMELIDPAFVEAADTITKRKKKVWMKWMPIAACFCLLLTGAEFFAKFGMWSTYDYALASSNEILNEYSNGLEFPEQIGDYSFDYLQSLSVVPHGVLFVQSLFDAAYHSLSFTYQNNELDVNGNPIVQRTLSIDIGKTDEEYWSVYFSFDPEILEFTPDENVINLCVVEFQGHTIYIFDRNMPDIKTISHEAVWLEPECGLCVSLSLYDTEENLPIDIIYYVEIVHNLFVSMN